MLQELQNVATLPTLDEARAKIASILRSPAQKITSILLAPASKIAILALEKSVKNKPYKNTKYYGRLK